jgi:hypothetical protein
MWTKLTSRLLFVVALALALGSAALLVRLLLDRDDSSAAESDITEAAVRSGSGTGPVTVSAKGLRTLAAALEQPIYWAGARPGYRYSLRQASDGQFYVRYLPPGTGVDDSGRRQLIVATYPEENALAELRSEARREGGFTVALPRGGVAYFREQRSRNVFVAYPGSRYQIEVFDPTPQRARRLVTEGRIVPVR